MCTSNLTEAVQNIWISFAPDGALYVVDMYRELIETALALPPDVLQQLQAGGGDDLQLWGSANLAHCNVQGGVVPGPGNVSVQPSFAADGYHLRPGSPMVDAGVRVTNGATEDIDGQARVFGRAPDIGADELRWHEAEVSMP